MHTDRIPGFAICARCAGRSGLGPCYRCGLLMCKLCRGQGECAVCFHEQAVASARTERRRLVRLAAQRVGVVACIAATGAAGVGAALFGQPCVGADEAHAMIVARGEVRFVADAIQRFSEAHGAPCPPSLRELRQEGYLVAPTIDPSIDPWGEALLFGCIESPRSFVVVSKGQDRQPGTVDDISFSVP